MEPSPETILRYGRPGDPVPGSRFVRAYCHNCAEPLRVPFGTRLEHQECDGCRGTWLRKMISQPRSIRTQTRGPVRNEPQSSRRVFESAKSAQSVDHLFSVGQGGPPCETPS